MERALLLDTERVRFAEEAAYALTPGSSTAEAVRHGIALAQAGALALAMDRAGGGAGAAGILRRLGRDPQAAARSRWRVPAGPVFEGLEIQAAEPVDRPPRD